MLNTGTMHNTEAAQRSKRMSVPQITLRLEGLTIMVAAIVLYAEIDASWLLFFALLFTPDLSVIAWVINQRVGIAVYNAVHTYIWPVLLGALGIVLDVSLLTHIALIWMTHIGMDRTLGYGLKLDAFKDTHITRV